MTGRPSPSHGQKNWRNAHELVPVCPEQLGGLPTPRHPSERQGERVVMDTGADVTEPYSRGAEAALRLCRLLHCQAAILKERSHPAAAGRYTTEPLPAH